MCLCFVFQVRSRTAAAGRDATGASPGRTNWRGITANTRAPSLSNASRAVAASLARTIWRCTWSATKTNGLLYFNHFNVWYFTVVLNRRSNIQYASTSSANNYTPGLNTYVLRENRTSRDHHRKSVNRMYSTVHMFCMRVYVDECENMLWIHEYTWPFSKFQNAFLLNLVFLITWNLMLEWMNPRWYFINFGISIM